MPSLLIQEISEDESSKDITNRSIKLTKVEETLRRLLLDVVDFIESTPVPEGAVSQVKLSPELAAQRLVLRFTGGWVRDKLLGVKSHDIDVAINKMTGEQFGLRLKGYLEIPGNAEKYGLTGVATTEKQHQKAMTSDKSKMVGGLHKIEANPEKSKHLETITTTIFGLDIDLVNLRKETYTDDSRNPQIEFGTPEEDALRRDATVNALFYNIASQEVEDFTGLGHLDMKRKVIRTPLEPYQTFKDDPLRVLRLIRFSSRLGYAIEPSALEAMRHPDITAALRIKISRERVGVEIEKALRGPDPHEALRLVFDLNLYFTVFSNPLTIEGEHFDPDQTNWRLYLDRLEDCIANDRPIARYLVREDEERFLAWQLSALIPYRDAPLPEATAPGRRAPPPVSASVAREGIKATNKVCDLVTSAVRHYEDISGLVELVYRGQQEHKKATPVAKDATRDVLGMAIRRWGPTWRSQVVYSWLAETANLEDTSEKAAYDIEKRYDAFLQQLNAFDLMDACSLKPLLDGKALASALGIAPGPWMKDALDVVMAWQLRHPDVTDASQAIEEVRRRRGELTSALAHQFLKLTIRPLFLQTKRATISSQARKILSPTLPEKLVATTLDESRTRPWKSAQERHVLDILRWVAGALDARLSEQLWALIIPPVLTLVDDWESRYKLVGLQCLHDILTVSEGALMRRTGLDDVFEQALLPCLTMLPPLTPDEESVKILDLTFASLLALYSASCIDKSEVGVNRQAYAKVLIKLLRKGVFYAYESCSNRPRIVITVFKYLSTILDNLGIDTVSHLREIIVMLTATVQSRVLAEDTDQHTCLLQAIDALQSAIRNGWPRIAVYRGEVMKGLTQCWLALADQNAAEVRGGLRQTLRVLRKALSKDGSGSSFEGECRQLAGINHRLDGLLL